MGYKLYREVRDLAPDDWTSGELVVALMIADDANDDTRRSWMALGTLCARSRLQPIGVRKALARLGARGYELRVCHGYGKDGRPVYAARGHAVDYLIPDLSKGALLVSPFEPIGDPRGSANGQERRSSGVLKAIPQGPKGDPTGSPLSSVSPHSPQTPPLPLVTPTGGRQLDGGAARQPIEELAYAAWLMQRRTQAR